MSCAWRAAGWRAPRRAGVALAREHTLCMGNVAAFLLAGTCPSPDLSPDLLFLVGARKENLYNSLETFPHLKCWTLLTFCLTWCWLSAGALRMATCGQVDAIARRAYRLANAFLPAPPRHLPSSTTHLPAASTAYRLFRHLHLLSGSGPRGVTRRVTATMPPSAARSICFFWDLLAFSPFRLFFLL